LEGLGHHEESDQFFKGRMNEDKIGEEFGLEKLDFDLLDFQGFQALNCEKIELSAIKCVNNQGAKNQNIGENKKN
jgi:hypothetical protein